MQILFSSLGAFKFLRPRSLPFRCQKQSLQPSWLLDVVMQDSNEIPDTRKADALTLDNTVLLITSFLLELEN